LEGKIEAGDFDKFKNFILNGDNAVEIYLASPGGDLAEAMRIGVLVRLLKLSTVIPSKSLTNQNRELAVARLNLKDPKADYMCASACFFVFVSGIHRRSDELGPAILGIHRPSLSTASLQRLNFDQAAAADNRTRTAVENYLKVMDVPAKYAENMYSVPKGKIQWIRNDEFAADFGGFIPELRDWVDARCHNRNDMDKKNGGDCEKKAQVELAQRAYGDALARQQGKIPQ
jgi:hypothetical protein